MVYEKGVRSNLVGHLYLFASTDGQGKSAAGCQGER
jgi:hypothetical protein